ncbi:MAG: energy-coupling factor ABC transporter ATP-binding protein [Candidatus Nanopelagicaceae bacterium]|jgi:cobalt/nickel transport system ATP-binding protein
MSSPLALKVSELAFAYPDGHQALFGINLEITPGERVALLGPNGAGKTTFVMHLNGIHQAQHGSVEIDGITIDVSDKERLKEIRSKVGLVFQDPDDQLFMPTVYEDVAFGPRNLGLTSSEVESRVHASLARVGMAEFADRPPHHLSFGQRRRVAVATVLAMDPSILVLDEPSSNLDPASRRELAEILTDLPITLIMVTHDLPFAYELCERSVILAEGAIVADDRTERILRNSDLLSRYRLELPKGFALS